MKNSAKLIIFYFFLTILYVYYGYTRLAVVSYFSTFFSFSNLIFFQIITTYVNFANRILSLLICSRQIRMSSEMYHSLHVGFQCVGT